jgi:hypothetical protein
MLGAVSQSLVHHSSQRFGVDIFAARQLEIGKEIWEVVDYVDHIREEVWQSNSEKFDRMITRLRIQPELRGYLERAIQRKLRYSEDFLNMFKLCFYMFVFNSRRLIKWEADNVGAYELISRVTYALRMEVLRNEFIYEVICEGFFFGQGACSAEMFSLPPDLVQQYDLVDPVLFVKEAVDLVYNVPGAKKNVVFNQDLGEEVVQLVEEQLCIECPLVVGIKMEVIKHECDENSYSKMQQVYTIGHYEYDRIREMVLMDKTNKLRDGKPPKNVRIQIDIVFEVGDDEVDIKVVKCRDSKFSCHKRTSSCNGDLHISNYVAGSSVISKVDGVYVKSKPPLIVGCTFSRQVVLKQATMRVYYQYCSNAFIVLKTIEEWTALKKKWGPYYYSVVSASAGSYDSREYGWRINKLVDLFQREKSDTRRIREYERAMMSSACMSLYLHDVAHIRRMCEQKAYGFPERVAF